MIHNTNHTPRWVAVIIIVAALPVFALPTLLSLAGNSPQPIVKTLLWGYPLYVLLAGWLSWISYDRRPYMTWLLIVIMLLTHAAMWILVKMPQL